MEKGHRATRRDADFPQLWRAVWSSEKIPAKRANSPMWTGREILIESGSGTLLCSPTPRGRREGACKSVERQIELTAESLWNDVAARLREALNDTTFQTWFGEVDGRRARRRHLRGRRPERLHARVDRGALPRPDPRRGAGRRRRRSCASSSGSRSRRAAAAGRHAVPSAVTPAAARGRRAARARPPASTRSTPSTPS